MTYIPTGAKWYIAGLVEEITVEGASQNIVHKNLVLVRADSPEKAYEEAVEMGQQRQVSYENPAGKEVRITFRGLSELNVIHDDLDHGAELLYWEKGGVSNSKIEEWILPKEKLSVFRPTMRSSLPDYSCK
jgi:hypothetical protein